MEYNVNIIGEGVKRISFDREPARNDIIFFDGQELIISEIQHHYTYSKEYGDYGDDIIPHMGEVMIITTNA